MAAMLERCPVAASAQTSVRCTKVLAPQSQHLAPRQRLVNTFRPVHRVARQQRCLAVRSVLEETALPPTYVRYETMIILRPDMGDEGRDIELAKFQSFLDKQGAKEVNSVIRGRQPLAYPMKGKWEGVYVLYTYAAHPSTSTAVQKMLSTPDAGGESNILRHMTFRL